MSTFDHSCEIDELILPVVHILNSHGFKTFDSCQGGEGHPFPDGYIRFEGSEYDLMRAFDICHAYGLPVMGASRIFRRAPIYINDNTPQVVKIGDAWETPFNELTFLATGLISLKKLLLAPQEDLSLLKEESA